MSVSFLGVCQSYTAATFAGSTQVHPPNDVSQKANPIPSKVVLGELRVQLMCSQGHKHFFQVNSMLLLASRINQNVVDNTTTNLFNNSRNTRLIRSTKYAGVLVSPNDMTNHSNKPSVVLNVVFSMLPPATRN